MRKHITFLLLSLIVVSCVLSVKVPDYAFKNYLINNPEINTNGDKKIQLSETKAFNGALLLPNLEINDLTEVETFVNITGLNCFNNQLTSLNLSNNTALNYLYCSANQLTSLDVSNNNELLYLGCSNLNDYSFDHRK